MTDNSYKIALDELFEDVLDNCLARVLDGRATIDECCAANPGFANGLRPLMETAVAARHALGEDMPASTPAPAAVKSGARSSSRGRMLRPLAIASGVFVLLFAGSAMAASSAQPDSVFYSLKQGMEEARTELARGNQSQARIENGHANIRLDELQTTIDAGKPDYIPELLGRYEENIDAATGYAAAAAADGEDVSEINGMIQATRMRHAEMVAAMSDDVPAEGAKALRESVEATGAGSVQQPQEAEEPGQDSGRGGGENHENGGSGENSGNHDSGSGGDQDSYGSGSGGWQSHGGDSSQNDAPSSPSQDAESHKDANHDASRYEGISPQTSVQPHSSGSGNSGH
ncbi:MAG: DUF5667 domain-containing protein [Actinobacteria bacterium]|nr:DUF5667 domain-containing protein [Actinomycetota bacterium]MCL5882695.1 DUF5667 domain-containing protein [Actinomycetota bacterium]